MRPTWRARLQNRPFDFGFTFCTGNVGVARDEVLEFYFLLVQGRARRWLPLGPNRGWGAETTECSSPVVRASVERVWASMTDGLTSTCLPGEAIDDTRRARLPMASTPTPMQLWRGARRLVAKL